MLKGGRAAECRTCGQETAGEGKNNLLITRGTQLQELKAQQEQRQNPSEQEGRQKGQKQTLKIQQMEIKSGKTVSTQSEQITTKINVSEFWSDLGF